VASELDVAEIVENKICGEDSELLALLQKNLKISEYTLFKMKHLDGKSNDEIAEFIGIKKHSVDVKITRLHEKIKEVLAGTKYERETAPSKLKRVAVLLALLVVATLLLQGVAMALGYDTFIDMIRAALASPEVAVSDLSGENEMLRTDGVRFYDSMSEMLEIENLDILFPARLPVGYSFANFIVIESGDNLRIQATATEPLIEFIVHIESNFSVDNLDYETNGVKYRIVENGDNTYQADFRHNTDYYRIVVSNRDILSEIINNLSRE